jgi:hypothetical protein
MRWGAVGLMVAVSAIIGLAIFFWRYGVSEHEEDIREDRRMERLMFRMLEHQVEMLKAQHTTNVLLAELVREGAPPPVADHFDLVSTVPR